MGYSLAARRIAQTPNAGMWTAPAHTCFGAIQLFEKPEGTHCPGLRPPNELYARRHVAVGLAIRLPQLSSLPTRSFLT